MVASKTIFGSFAFLALVILSVGFAFSQSSPIFSDDFETGTVGSAPAGWTVSNTASQNDWSISDNNGAGSSTQHIEANPGMGATASTTTIEIPVDTTGFENIEFNYERQLGETGAGTGFDIGDEFIASWSSDGNTFNVLEDSNESQTSPINDPNYVSMSFNNLPTGADDNPTFTIKFECTTSAADEFCRVDDVSITGTAIPTPTSNLQIIVPSPTTPIKLLPNTNTSITIDNLGTSTLTNIMLTDFSSLGAIFTPSSISTLSSTASPVSINVILDSLFSSLKFGLHTLTVQASGTEQGTSNTVTNTASIQVEKHFCRFGEIPGNLSITKVKVDNQGEGDNNNWDLLDEIEVEIKARNDNQDDDVDVVFKLGLFDGTGQNFADDLEFSVDSDGDDEEYNTNIDEDDDVEFSYIFKVPADFDDGNYKLAIKVYDDDEGEDFQCADTSTDLDSTFFEAVSVDRITEDDREVVVDDIRIDNSQVSCGETVSGQFTVYNIGTDDQDRVKITMKNTELGLDETFEVTNLDPGDDEVISFNFNVPAGVSDGTKRLDFRTLYKYKNGIYKEESEKTFNGFVEVLGCTTNLVGPAQSSTAIITASLQSDAVAGQALVIDSTITNVGDETETFTISARGFSSWATLEDISVSSITLEPGQTGDVEFTFNVQEDAEGSQSFTIQTAAGAKIDAQEVEVNIKSSSEGFNFDFGDNGIVWVIAIVNLALILLIIVVAVRLSRR